MDLFEVIQERRSIRKFKPERVARGDLRKILESGRLAPSGGNHQPWYFIIVRDRETKKTLSIAANNQEFIADADTVIVALGESRTSTALQALLNKLPYRLFASATRIPHMQDPMIAIEHMILVATALGYGTCWIGAFDEDEVKRILKIPENLAVIALLPVGIPDESPPPRPRKAFGEIFFKELHGTPLEL